MLRPFLRVIRNDSPPQTVSKPTAPTPPMEAGGVDHSDAARREQRFLTRQPILDASGNAVGHEFRLRDRMPVMVIPGASSPTQMRDEMLLVSLIDLEHQRSLGNLPAFLTVAPETLFNPLLEQLPRGKVVVTLQTPPRPDEQVVARWRQLTEQGFNLALENIENVEDYAPLLPHCRHIRQDIGRQDALSMGKWLDRLPQGNKPRLTALGVETEEAFEACRKLSFDLFQGWYFTRLRPSAPHRLESSRLRVMELLNLVIAQSDIPPLEERFKCDAGLSLRLLRYINSPAIGLRAPVQSIAHALVILGHDQLYRWLTLLLFTSGPVDPRSRALMRSALVRARLTENLGRDRLRADQRGGLFITGILSLLDALLNLPMEQAIANLNLPEDVVAALVRREGPFVPYLELAIACENFDQDSLARLAETHGLIADEVNLAHVNALIWSEGLDI